MVFSLFALAFSHNVEFALTFLGIACPGALIGEQPGLDKVHAELMPAGQVTITARLKSEVHRAAMIGDGLNDAAAIATADVGMAMGVGTDVYIQGADVIPVGHHVANWCTRARCPRQRGATRIKTRSSPWAPWYCCSPASCCKRSSWQRECSSTRSA